jgi:arabinan endo-1,5-alpha-L-arabinosidase
VEGTPVGGRRGRGLPPGAGPGATPGGAPGGATSGGPRIFQGQAGVIPPQDVAQVSKDWPTGNVDVRMANYLCQAQQKWTITAATDGGGYPGSPYFKITIAGTDRALAATADAELTVLPAFTGGSEQLWRMDQLADGTWRIMPKAVPSTKEVFVLSATGSSFATLAKFDANKDRHRWLFKTP